MDTPTGADPPPRLQQRAVAVSAADHRPEEASGGAAGLQHPRGESLPAGHLHLQGGARLGCPQGGAAGGGPGAVCERRRLSGHRALEGCGDSENCQRDPDEGALLPLQLPATEGEDCALGGSSALHLLDTLEHLEERKCVSFAGSSLCFSTGVSTPGAGPPG